MCNIVTFRFTCQHTLRRRRSRCGGTKHKITATSTKAACIAESFLTIYLRIECDPCQHKAWEAVWKLKLARANTFLTKVRQRAMPGSEEIAVLVKHLEAEYTTASWNTRTMFAHAPKPSITRVKHSWYERATSKLPRELRPEDIIEKKTKEWTEMDDEDYDGNYEASTDPLHPVSTDYSHPLDDDDGAWILQHISEEDMAGNRDSVGFDFGNGHGWSWGEDNNVSDSLETTGQWQENPTEHNEQERSTRSNQDTGESLVAEAPNADSIYSTDDIYITARQGKEAEHKAKVEEVIQAFWSVVNHNDKYTEPQTPPTTPAPNTNALASVLACLHVDDCESFSTRKPTTPPREHTLWTDGPLTHHLLCRQQCRPNHHCLCLDHLHHRVPTRREHGMTSSARFSSGEETLISPSTIATGCTSRDARCETLEGRMGT
jgi:hypothetical protein